MTTTAQLYRPGITAPHRLHYFRKQAEKHPRLYADWREARRCRRWLDAVAAAKPVFQTLEEARYCALHASPSDRRMFADDLDHLPGRQTGDAGELARLDHTGWYADSFCDELVRGAVMQLPSKDGEHRYYPATYRTESDGVTGWPLDWYETPEEAARAADSHAEREAEDCREWNAQAQAEMQREDNQVAMAAAREQVHALGLELRQLEEARQELPPTICQALRDLIRQHRQECHRLARRCAELREDYWQAVTD